MPRTLPAALTTAMDSGIYEPYFRLVYNGDPEEAGQLEVQPISYVLEPLRLFITIPDSSDDLSYFRLRRGAVINGSPVYISTIWFKKVFESHNGRVTTLIGEPLERNYLATAGTGYADVIGEATARASDEIIARYEGTNPAWRLYEFYKDSQPVILSPRSKLFPLLAQKYLIYATEDGFDESASENYMWFFQATTARSTDYIVNDPFLTVTDQQEARRLIATDEIGTLRSSGAVTDVIHNLGFLHSTADMPTNTANSNVGSTTSHIPVHLKYRTGDKVSLIGTNCSTTQRVTVTEVLNPKATPAWYMVLKTLQYYGGSDGNVQPDLVTGSAQMSGPYLPPLILGGGTVIVDGNGNINLGTAPTPGGINLGSAPTPAPSYSPLFTGSFNSALSETDSNIQEAFETLDRHTHTGLVTNGNSHDHNGGDGGQINHTTLSNIGTNTHPQIDTHLAAAAPHSGHAASVHSHTSKQALFGHGLSGTVPASSTRWLGFELFTGILGGASNLKVTEAATIKNLKINTIGSQPASGSMVITLNVNDVASAIVVTIAAGSGLGEFSDTTHSVSLNAGDRIGMVAVNNATAASAPIIAIGALLQFTTV